MSDGPKIVDLPEKKNQVAAAGDHLKRDLPHLIDNMDNIAKFRHAAFQAYVKAGFTEAQALELCCR